MTPPKPDHSGIKLQEAARQHQAGNFTVAQAQYRNLLKNNYDIANTANLLAILLLQTSKFDEAIPLFEQAIRAGNSSADIPYNIGFCLAESKKYSQAAQAYRRCLQIDPKHHSAYFNLGIALANDEQNDEAIVAFMQDLGVKPRQESHVELSSIYLKKFDWDNTERHAIAILEKDSHHEIALYNLATARLGRLIGAEIPDLKIIEQIMRLGKSMIAAHPASARGYSICADALQMIGEIDLALEYYEKSLIFDPESAHVHANTGVIYLMKGELEKGWREISWRGEYGTKLYGMDIDSYGRCPAPEWDGVVRPGKHILVSSEQGIGDQLMQAQLVCELIEAGMQVTLTCNDKLISLLQRSIPGATLYANSQPIPDTTLQTIDYKTPQLELVGKMRPALDSFKKRYVYLQPNPELVDHFKRKYASNDGKLKIGIAWKSTSVSSGKAKSTKLTQWRSILAVPNCQFFSVQYGDINADIAEAKDTLGVSVYVDDEFNPYDDIEKAAAQIAALDLIISVSNASVHIAGAMGKPCWVMLHTMPLWHWFNRGKTSVWYDSVCLYRQNQLEGWTPIMETVAADLSQLATITTSTP